MKPSNMKQNMKCLKQPLHLTFYSLSFLDHKSFGLWKIHLPVLTILTFLASLLQQTPLTSPSPWQTESLPPLKAVAITMAASSALFYEEQGSMASSDWHLLNRALDVTPKPPGNHVMISRKPLNCAGFRWTIKKNLTHNWIKPQLRVVAQKALRTTLQYYV